MDFQGKNDSRKSIFEELERSTNNKKPQKRLYDSRNMQDC
jgi:hypothetical protein